MAVYTNIDSVDVAALLERYDIGRLVSHTGISEGVENTNYALTTTSGRYILTLIEKRTNAEDLPFYVTFMDYLREENIPSPETAITKNGQKISDLKGKPAIITTFLDGAWPREITTHHCAQTGQLQARMHAAGRRFSLKRKNTLSLPAWRTLIHACQDKADTLEKGLLSFLDAELDFLQLHWPKYLPKGAVHADLFPDNVFFENEKVSGVIDFYFSCWDTLTYDLMLAFNPWCFDKTGVLDAEKAGAFLKSYHTHRPLSRAEQKALPFFGRAAAMRIIATRLYDWLNPADGALVTPKDPMEHVRILRFHQKAESPATYGFLP